MSSIFSLILSPLFSWLVPQGIDVLSAAADDLLKQELHSCYLPHQKIYLCKPGWIFLRPVYTDEKEKWLEEREKCFEKLLDDRLKTEDNLLEVWCLRKNKPTIYSYEPQYTCTQLDTNYVCATIEEYELSQSNL